MLTWKDHVRFEITSVQHAVANDLLPSDTYDHLQRSVLLEEYPITKAQLQERFMGRLALTVELLVHFQERIYSRLDAVNTPQLDGSLCKDVGGLVRAGAPEHTA